MSTENTTGTKFGVRTAGADVELLVGIEPGKTYTIPMEPREARRLAAYLITAATEVDPEGHQAEIDAAAALVLERVALAALPVTGKH